MTHLSKATEKVVLYKTTVPGGLLSTWRRSDPHRPMAFLGQCGETWGSVAKLGAVWRKSNQPPLFAITFSSSKFKAEMTGSWGRCGPEGDVTGHPSGIHTTGCNPFKVFELKYYALLLNVTMGGAGDIINRFIHGASPQACTSLHGNPNQWTEIFSSRWGFEHSYSTSGHACQVQSYCGPHLRLRL